jgi:hypothetical protein
MDKSIIMKKSKFLSKFKENNQFISCEVLINLVFWNVEIIIIKSVLILE